MPSEMGTAIWVELIIKRLLLMTSRRDARGVGR